jgi:hypothetical protein
MKLEALLKKFPSLKLEQPPELWEARTDESRLLTLLQAMISATAADTFNISNVVVEPSADASPIPEGEFVALTVSGQNGSEPDGNWPGKSKLLAGLEGELAAAGVRYAYVRSIRGKGSITVFLDRQ